MEIDVVKFALDETGHGTVEINGVKLESVTGLRLTAKPGELTKVEIELIASVEGGAEIVAEA